MPDTKKMTWIDCPNCTRHLFRWEQEKKFNIEIACNHCKAIYQIYSEGAGISFVQVREPKYSYKPKEFKGE